MTDNKNTENAPSRTPALDRLFKVPEGFTEKLKSRPEGVAKPTPVAKPAPSVASVASAPSATSAPAALSIPYSKQSRGCSKKSSTTL